MCGHRSDIFPTKSCYLQRNNLTAGLSIAWGERTMLGRQLCNSGMWKVPTLKTKSLLCIERGGKGAYMMSWGLRNKTLCVIHVQGCTFLLSFMTGREQRPLSFHRAWFFLHTTAIPTSIAGVECRPAESWRRWGFHPRAGSRCLFILPRNLLILSFGDWLSISTLTLT